LFSALSCGSEEVLDKSDDKSIAYRVSEGQIDNTRREWVTIITPNRGVTSCLNRVGAAVETDARQHGEAEECENSGF
jgi:hypothetical protein